jgi:hypothetical protein
MIKVIILLISLLGVYSDYTAASNFNLNSILKKPLYLNALLSTKELQLYQPYCLGLYFSQLSNGNILSMDTSLIDNSFTNNEWTAAQKNSGTWQAAQPSSGSSSGYEEEGGQNYNEEERGQNYNEEEGEMGGWMFEEEGWLFGIEEEQQKPRFTDAIWTYFDSSNGIYGLVLKESDGSQLFALLTESWQNSFLSFSDILVQAINNGFPSDSFGWNFLQCSSYTFGTQSGAPSQTPVPVSQPTSAQAGGEEEGASMAGSAEEEGAMLAGGNAGNGTP